MKSVHAKMIKETEVVFNNDIYRGHSIDVAIAEMRVDTNLTDIEKNMNSGHMKHS